MTTASGAEFREFLQKMRVECPLNLPPKTRSSENEDDGKNQSKKRKINAPGNAPAGSKTDGEKEPATVAEEVTLSDLAT